MTMVEIHAPVVPILIPDFVEIVHIRTFDMNNIAEESFLRHIECSSFEEVVDTVFEHHAMFASLLRSIDELPYLIERSSSRNLYRYILAMLHGIDSNRRMVYPIGDDINEIDILAVAKFLPGIGIAGIGLGTWQAHFFECALSTIHSVGFDITKSYNFEPFDLRNHFECALTTHTESDNTYTHLVHLGCSELKYILLASRTHGNSSFYQRRSIGSLSLSRDHRAHG